MIYLAVLVIALGLDAGNYAAWCAYERGASQPTLIGAAVMIAVSTALLAASAAVARRAR